MKYFIKKDKDKGERIMFMPELDSKCSHFEDCVQNLIIEMFANIGGRTANTNLPSCDECIFREENDICQ